MLSKWDVGSFMRSPRFQPQIKRIRGAPIKSFPMPSGLSLSFRWTPDGKAIMYPMRRRGVGNLWVQPIEGGDAKQFIGNSPSFSRRIRYLPNLPARVFSKRLVSCTHQHALSIWQPSNVSDVLKFSLTKEMTFVGCEHATTTSAAYYDGVTV